MARQEAARTGIFSTRSELEAELDRLGALGEFDTVIARKTGIPTASVAEYLRSRPARPRRPVVKEVGKPRPATVEAAMSLPLEADDRRVLNSDGELLAYAASASVAVALTTAINSAGALAAAMVASPVAGPKAPATDALPKRRVGRPRKPTAAPPARADGVSPAVPVVRPSPQPAKRPVGRPRKHPVPEALGAADPERRKDATTGAEAASGSDGPQHGRPGRKPRADAGRPGRARAANEKPANEERGGRLAPRP